MNENSKVYLITLDISFSTEKAISLDGFRGIVAQALKLWREKYGEEITALPGQIHKARIVAHDVLAEEYFQKEEVSENGKREDG
jgi:hypothetical protein